MATSLSLDDDVPPLEDMSDLLTQVQEIQKTKEKVPEPLKFNESRNQRNEEAKADNKETKAVKTSKAPTSKGTGDTFMGMKKGFLLNGFGSDKPKKTPVRTQQKPPQESMKEIPLIVPKNEGSKGHQIKEVQDAMADAIPLLGSNDWVTSDLLQKFEKHPRLAKQLSDPKITQAMAKFQTDPEGAKREYAKNPEIQLFFKEFCDILGTHFSKIAANAPTHLNPGTSEIRTQGNGGVDMSVRSSTNPNQPTAADEEKMKQLLSDPEIYDVFSDERIKKLMEALKFHPDKAQRMIKTASPRLQRKIQKLVDCGLLAFAS